jgi:threonine synthase
MSYQEIAFAVMKRFTGNTFSDEKFKEMIDSAYSDFDHKAICPMVQLSENHFLLELFHGPTLAFKDVAMQLIGQMFDYVLRKKNLRATIIAATSGDTGSAAMDAFKNSELVDLFILFPEGRVSEVQKRQMTTLGCPNIHALALDGDFDDCQALVKRMFNDHKFRKQVHLTGVNSINWARVMSQIVYYFSSAVALGAPKLKVSFTVPTGNFGDIFAAYVAQKMGLPIDRLVIASNQNDILHRTLLTGRYRKQGLVHTISPSMDIQVASNFERLLFDLYGGSSEPIKMLMQSLDQDGSFELSSKVLDKLRESFSSGSVSEEEILKTMKQVLEDFDELICPHTAVGLSVANRIRKNDSGSPMITLATAHPAKFSNVVIQSTGVTPALPKRYDDLFSKNEVVTYVKNDLNEIKTIISERIL